MDYWIFNNENVFEMFLNEIFTAWIKMQAWLTQCIFFSVGAIQHAFCFKNTFTSLSLSPYDMVLHLAGKCTGSPPNFTTSW